MIWPENITARSQDFHTSYHDAGQFYWMNAELIQRNKSLYSNGKNKPRIKSGYGSEEIAKKTLKRIKGHSKAYQIQIINTMYNRAKYHKYQTDGMKKAMKVYKKWLNSRK